MLLQATKLISLLDKYNRNFALKVNTFNTTTDNLPPTSTQSFLRHNATFPAVVLHSPSQPPSNTNHFYHSALDDTANIGFVYANTSLDFTKLGSLTDNTASPFADNSVQMAVRNVSTLLAFTLYELVLNQYYPRAEIGSAVLVSVFFLLRVLNQCDTFHRTIQLSLQADEILHCYLETMDCPLFRAAAPTPNIKNYPYPASRYISVQSLSTTVLWTYRILGYLVGQPNDHTKENCSHLPFAWYMGYNGTGECRYTTQNFSTAQSPAFLIDGSYFDCNFPFITLHYKHHVPPRLDYDFASGRYSTWTESTWQELSSRIFLKPSTSHEALTLAIGFVVMTLSFVIVFLVNSKSDILFGEAVTTHVARP